MQDGGGRPDHDRHAEGDCPGATFTGRRRGRSSSSRTAGITRVARHGRCVFTSVRHSASWARRSASSRNRRCLKNDPSPSRRDSRSILFAPD